MIDDAPAQEPSRDAEPTPSGLLEAFQAVPPKTEDFEVSRDGDDEQESRKDFELAAMQTIVRMLKRLPTDARDRVVHWVHSRYCARDA